MPLVLLPYTCINIQVLKKQAYRPVHDSALHVCPIPLNTSSSDCTSFWSECSMTRINIPLVQVQDNVRTCTCTCTLQEASERDVYEMQCVILVTSCTIKPCDKIGIMYHVHIMDAYLMCALDYTCI